VRSRVTILTATILAAATVSASSHASPPTCRAAQLQGRLSGSNGAAGTIILYVTLTNGGTTCAMKGYPGLILMHGVNPLTTRVAHGGLSLLSQKPRLVLLAHGGAATFLVGYSDVVTGDEQSCPSSDAMLVRPPSQTNWIRVAARVQACSRGTLRESPVLPGRHAP